MEVQLHKTQEQNEKLERRLKEQEDLNKRKDDELLEAKSKVSSMLATQSLHCQQFLVPKAAIQVIVIIGRFFLNFLKFLQYWMIFPI